MARRRPVDDEEPAEEPDEEEEDDEEPSPPPKRRHPTAPKRRAVRAWKTGAAGAEEEDEEDSGPPRPWYRRSNRPVLFGARDSVYFEPLVAIAIVALILVSLYAYAQNWPPAYVIESNSMQHGSTDTVGLINTGDLVIAQKISTSQIVPYVVGAQDGYKTYGEYGDVVLYHPNGDTSVSPVIHRAILYIEYANASYSVPELSGAPCGDQANAWYNVSEYASGCGTTGLHGRLTLYHVGWQGAEVNISLTPQALGTSSGYLTMGDNNLVPGSPPTGLPDQPALSRLVQPAWILGVARGMIPWFGSLKLLLSGNAGEVPAGSWEFLGLTFIGIFLAAAGVHYALRAEGIEDERRREMEEEEAELEEETPRRRWHLRRDHDDDEEDEERDERPPRGDGRGILWRLQPRNWGAERPGGRPPPSVRRGNSPNRRRGRSGSDEEDDL
jgi:signal peptidase